MTAEGEGVKVESSASVGIPEVADQKVTTIYLSYMFGDKVNFEY